MIAYFLPVRMSYATISAHIVVHVVIYLPHGAIGGFWIYAPLLLYNNLLAIEGAFLEGVLNSNSFVFFVPRVLLESIVCRLIKRRRNCNLHIPAQMDAAQMDAGIVRLQQIQNDSTQKHLDKKYDKHVSALQADMCGVYASRWRDQPVAHTFHRIDCSSRGRRRR